MVTEAVIFSESSTKGSGTGWRSLLGALRLVGRAEAVGTLISK